MITLESFKKLYESLDGEPEFRISIKGLPDDYMIIKYPDGAEFQRCGNIEHCQAAFRDPNQIVE